MLNSTWQHPLRAEQNGRIAAAPFSFHGEAQTLFAPQCIPTDGGWKEAIAAIIRACSSIHYGEQLARPPRRQPVSGRRA